MTDGHHIPAAETISDKILRIMQAWLPVLTVVGGAIWALTTFLAHERDTARDLAQQVDKEAKTRAIEARQPFLKKQLSLYYEAASVAGKLVSLSSPNEPEWHDSERRFWELYWSELAMVEDPPVETAMVGFSDALNNYKAAHRNAPAADADKLQDARRPMNNAALDLAHAIRASISTQWDYRDSNQH
ncbi:hypothetical protein FBZ93_111248 [Bradyrhizobium macuxiense]|uniref:Uncharacterized protein n=1 Tax=Bradyrhizobium macuxiense TaxID=1755647 RepID=A0A560LDC7_9BRAD|nr:hypothetical protein [Bradyrhizobium macuxiense]TWB93209.1 hypothetical protein FBZ93_111248 [Bradyrhizobium macuxiense]